MIDSERIETLREIILQYNLPRSDLALFGVLCPLCGKTDRIRELEPLEDLKNMLSQDEKAVELFEYCYKELLKTNFRLGVCKFCNMPIKIDSEKGQAFLLLEQ